MSYRIMCQYNQVADRSLLSQTACSIDWVSQGETYAWKEYSGILKSWDESCVVIVVMPHLRKVYYKVTDPLYEEELVLNSTKKIM